jgi:hypothetical protein
MPSESDLAVASQQVAGAKANVARQRERIARLRHAGYSTLDAERALGSCVPPSSERILHANRS